MAANTKSQPGRSEARQAATNSKSTASTGRGPAPREEGAGGTDAAATAPVPVEPTAIVVIAPNPKRANSLAYRHYNMYGPVGQLTNADACKKAGVRGKDLTWDAERGHIITDDAAKNFPVNGSKEEQANYLRGLTFEGGMKGSEIFTDAKLIKWGYLPKPEPVAEEPKQPATTNA